MVILPSSGGGEEFVQVDAVLAADGLRGGDEHLALKLVHPAEIVKGTNT